MELHDYLAILRKQWVVITVITLLGALAGLALALTGTPTYAATAKVFVSTTSGDSAAELAQGNSFTMQRVETYADLVTTAAVLEPTLEALGLESPLSSIRGRLSATSPDDTTIIDVTATGTNPQATAALATAAAEQLILVVEDWEQPTAASGSPVSLWIAQPAETPGAPQGASPLTSSAIGAFIGLCLGIAAALLLTVLDTRLRSQRDVARITTSAVLASIPYDPSTPSHPVQVLADSQGRNAEAYRTLRTNLEFVQGGRTGAPVLLTSSVPGEGKTTTAVNLAIALAHSDARVLLIEADLRRPRVGKTVGIESGVGLSDVLVGRVAMEDACQPWGANGLEILAAGTIPPNPAELLGSESMQMVLDLAASEYDHVIVDAPPLLAVTDAAVLARMVSKVMVVVGIGRAKSPELRSSLESLANVGAVPSGLVLSMVPTRGPDAYSYTYGGYAYTPEPEARPSRLRSLFRRKPAAAPSSEGGDAPAADDAGHAGDEPRFGDDHLLDEAAEPIVEADGDRPDAEAGPESEAELEAAPEPTSEPDVRAGDRTGDKDDLSEDDDALTEDGDSSALSADDDRVKARTGR